MNRQRSWLVRSGADFGAVIADLRSESQLTQEDLAKTTGLSQHYISRLESGMSSKMVDRIVLLLRRMGATITITTGPPRRDDAEA